MRMTERSDETVQNRADGGKFALYRVRRDGEYRYALLPRNALEREFQGDSKMVVTNSKRERKTR